MPAPDFNKEVEPLLGSTITLVSVLAPVLLPVSVRVRLPAPEATYEPVPVKFKAPFAVADASIVAPPAPKVNSRFVLSPAPVYLSVPLSRTSRDAAAPAAAVVPELPIELFDPPVASFVTSSVAPLPIKVLPE